jgi:hypothetical protein
MIFYLIVLIELSVKLSEVGRRCPKRFPGGAIRRRTSALTMRARACRLVLDSGLGAAAVWCTLPVHQVDQRATVDRREEESSVFHRLESRARSSFFSSVLRTDVASHVFGECHILDCSTYVAV